MYKAFLYIAFAFCSSIALAQIHIPGMPTQVGQTMEAQQNAWNSGDLEAFMVGYWESDSLLFIGSRGVNSGYITTLDNYRNSYPNKDAMGTLTFNNKSWIQICTNVGLLIGSWRISEKSQGIYSLIWKKIDGRWVIIADHSS